MAETQVSAAASSAPTSAAPAPSAPAQATTAAPAKAQPTVNPVHPGAQSVSDKELNKDWEAEQDRIDDQLIADTLHKHQLGPKPSKDSSAPEAPKSTDPADSDSDPSPEDGIEQPDADTLSEADAKVLERAHFPADSLPKDPQKRETFIKAMRERVEWGDRTQRELSELKKQFSAITQNPIFQQQQPQQPGQPRQLGEHWKELIKTVDDENDPKVTRAIEQGVEAVATRHGQAIFRHFEARFNELSSFVKERMRFEDEERGFADATFPDGVNKSADEPRNKVIEEALRLIEAERLRDPESFSLNKFNLRHAIPKAVSSVFAKEHKAAEAKARSERIARQKAGLPDSGSSPSTQVRRTEEEQEEEEIVQTLKKHGVPVLT